MQSLSDNDIDKLFIQAVQENQPPFDPADWNALETKLDKQYRFPYLTWFGALVVLGILSTSVWMGYTKWNNESASSSASENNTLIPESLALTPSSLPESNDTQVHGTQESSTSVVGVTAYSKQIVPSSARKNQTTAYKKDSPGVKDVIVSKDFDKRNSTPFIASSEISASSRLTTQPQIRNNTGSVSTDTLTQIKILTDSAATKEIAETKPEAEEEKEEEKSFYRFAVRAMVSPDYTSDRFKEAGKTGFNYGVDIHYFITPNISLSVGALRSRKYYTAQGAEYSGVVAEDLSGDCYMWDIPLNLRYTFAPHRKFTGFISTGLTSYLLSDETYSFQVQTGYYGGRQQYTMNVKNGNNEWFSVMNVSLGLQQRFNNHITWQLEPFVKIPLAEIGEGNIQLGSVGCFFAIQYSFWQRLSTKK